MSSVRTTLLKGFDDPQFPADQWNDLARSGPTASVFLSHEWQRLWWESFGRGALMLILAEREAPVALAPLFADDDGMAYLVGSGGSDYLDFIGDVSDPGVLEAVLDAAVSQIRDFRGLRFYHVPTESPMHMNLLQAARRLGLDACQEGMSVAPRLEFGSGTRPAEKKRVIQAERRLRVSGSLEVQHLVGEEAGAHLDEFFAQHVARWSETQTPSQFVSEKQQTFFRRVVKHGSDAGWLRFTRLDLDGIALAFHLGFALGDTFLFYKPTYNLAFAPRSPGLVLLRQALLAAEAEGLRIFDFGLGNEAYKMRFATSVRHVADWAVRCSGDEG